MSTPIAKILANCAQNFSDGEKLQARTNIGAIGGVRVADTSGTTDLVPDEQGRVTVDLTNAGKVQSDWEETNTNEASYIKNKPTIPPAPVQSDWAEDDGTSLAFIKNKPENLVQDPNYVHTDNNFTDNDKAKLDGIEAGAEKNVQADWNQSDASADDYIKNKPSIPAAQVQSDWNQSDSQAVDYIKNKPNLATVATSGSYNDLSDKPTIPQQVQSDWNQTDSSAVDYIKNKPANLVQDADYVHTDNNFTDNDKAKLDGIAAGAEQNVQADWAQTNSSADDFIKNKPNLATVATSGSYNDLSDKPDIPSQQVQSDWNQTDSSAVDYIKNKPANLVQDADYVHTDNNFTDNDKAKLDGIAAGAEQNVQADWAQTNSSADDFIKNKPNLATVATSGSYNDLSDKPDIPSQQVQSDWAETDTTDPAYIKNKPASMETKPLVPGTNIEFVQEENAVRINAIIPNAVIIYSGSPQMPQAQMDAISNMVNAHGTATILYGSPSGSTYWDLIKYDSSGYDFGRVSGATVEVMHVTQSGYVSITRYPVGGPKAYSLGNSDWYDNITLTGQTSNTPLVKHATALPNPITLYPGKNYLITGNCNGSAEWITTETTSGTNRFGICLALTKSDYSIQYNERVTVGQAQFYFHTDKGSRTPGYRFNVAIQGVTSVVSPSSEITLTNVVTYNSGNVLGCSSSNPAKLYTDFELGNLVVQEIS